MIDHVLWFSIIKYWAHIQVQKAFPYQDQLRNYIILQKTEAMAIGLK
jgi:hypothetical protein